MLHPGFWRRCPDVGREARAGTLSETTRGVVVDEVPFLLCIMFLLSCLFFEPFHNGITIACADHRPHTGGRNRVTNATQSCLFSGLKPSDSTSVCDVFILRRVCGEPVCCG